MKYKEIKTVYEPEITGCSNGVYSVEIKDKFSFRNDTEKNISKIFF